MFDRIRPHSRSWTLLAAVALVAFNAGCTSRPRHRRARWCRRRRSAPPCRCPASAPELSSGWTDKPGWTSQHFMIAAANPLATQAGYEMLKAGGTAIDAAIATQMVLALVEPQSSGIGGGAFCCTSTARQRRPDGRETAPPPRPTACSTGRPASR